MHLLQSPLYLTPEWRLQPRPHLVPVHIRHQRKRPDPLVPLRQHARNQLFAIRQIVVAHRQQMRNRLIQSRISAAQLSQCVPCRQRIHQVGSLYRTQPSAHPRQQRLPMRNPQTQRIDRLDIQPLRLLQNPPSTLFRIPERRPRQRYPLVFISRGFGSTRASSRCSNTRDRISAVAARVKVIARISSGSSTTASSFRNRRVSRVGFPRPCRSPHDKCPRQVERQRPLAEIHR